MSIPPLISNLAARTKLKYNIKVKSTGFDPTKRSKYWEKAIEEAAKDLRKDHGKEFKAFKLWAGNIYPDLFVIQAGSNLYGIEAKFGTKQTGSKEFSFKELRAEGLTPKEIIQAWITKKEQEANANLQKYSKGKFEKFTEIFYFDAIKASKGNLVTAVKVYRENSLKDLIDASDIRFRVFLKTGNIVGTKIKEIG